MISCWPYRRPFVVIIMVVSWQSQIFNSNALRSGGGNERWALMLRHITSTPSLIKDRAATTQVVLLATVRLLQRQSPLNSPGAWINGRSPGNPSQNPRLTGKFLPIPQFINALLLLSLATQPPVGYFWSVGNTNNRAGLDRLTGRPHIRYFSSVRSSGDQTIFESRRVGWDVEKERL